MANREADPNPNAEYARLFEGAVVCPINESAYIRRDKGAIIADLCGFYHAFGFDVNSGTGEKADHLATELEFKAMLFVMEHRSQTPDRQQVVREAISNFSRDHLGEWITLFCRRMEQTAQTPLYKAIATLRSAMWSVIASDLNLDTTRLPDMALHDSDSQVAGSSRAKSRDSMHPKRVFEDRLNAMSVTQGGVSSYRWEACWEALGQG